MKRILILAIVACVTTFFMGCEKEDLISKKKADMVLKSYDGNEFVYDDSFINPYEEYGINHNKLFVSIENAWESFAEANQLDGTLMDFAIGETEIITNNLLSDVGFSPIQFKEKICISSMEDFGDTYIETLQQFFLKFGGYYYDEFIYDVVDFAYETEKYQDAYHKISLIEQKIYNCKMPQNVKQYYLIFCSVARYSMMNLERIQSDEDSPFYLFTQTKGAQHGDAIVADAIGAVKGGYAGAVAGAAGGPAGSAILGTIGAVCVGGLSTAVEVGVKKNVSNWINSWFD